MDDREITKAMRYPEEFIPVDEEQRYNAMKVLVDYGYGEGDVMEDDFGNEYVLVIDQDEGGTRKNRWYLFNIR